MRKGQQLDLLPEQTDGEVLRQWRLAQGWSRRKAAEHFGVSVRSIENWEYGHRRPKALTLMKVLAASSRRGK